MFHATGPRSSARRCAHARVVLVLALLASTCVSAAANEAARDGTDVSAPICAAEATTGEDTTCDAPRMDAADTNGHGRLTGISTATEFLADRYVVRFDDYAPIEAHYASLVESLGPPVNKVDGVMGVKDTKAGAERGADGDTAVHPGDTAKVRWEWVVRDNPATRRFPTDFAVIKLGDDDHDVNDAKMTAEPRVESISSRGRIGADHKGAKASRIIGAMRGVRDVRREQKLTRSLAWEKGEGPPNDHDDDSANDANDHHSSPSSDESLDARSSPGVDPTSGGLRWGDGGEDVNGVPNRATRRRREKLANEAVDKDKIDSARGTAAAAAQPRADSAPAPPSAWNPPGTLQTPTPAACTTTTNRRMWMRHVAGPYWPPGTSSTRSTRVRCGKRASAEKASRLVSLFFIASVRAIRVTSCFGNRYFRHGRQSGSPALPQD